MSNEFNSLNSSHPRERARGAKWQRAKRGQSLTAYKSGLSRPMFSLFTSDSHLIYGGCGAIYIKYQRCPATAVAVRIRFWQGPRGERKGKGSRCEVATSKARPIPQNGRGERRGKGSRCVAVASKARPIPRVLIPIPQIPNNKKKQAPSLALALYPIQIRLPYTNRRIISSRSPARKSMMGISIIV